MKISVKRNLFFCLFVTTIVVLAVYQYCDANKTRCYPYPLDTHEPIYQLTNQSFLTLKEMSTSGHVKWIPKEIYKKNKTDGDVNDFIKFTSHLNAGNGIKTVVLLTPSPSTTATENEETEISRYKKETSLKIRNEGKEELNNINKKEKALRRFERVDRLIDDHDDEDDATLEKLRTMKSNARFYNHSTEDSIPTEVNQGQILISTVKFHPILPKIGESTNKNEGKVLTNETSIPTFNNGTVSRLDKAVSGIDKDTIDSQFTTLSDSSKETSQPSPQNFSERNVDAVGSIIGQQTPLSHQMDSDDLATLRDILVNSNDNQTKHSTLMRDIIQGNVHKILSNISKSPNSTIFPGKNSKPLKNLTMPLGALVEENLLGIAGSANLQTDDEMVEVETKSSPKGKIYGNIEEERNGAGIFENAEKKDGVRRNVVVDDSGSGNNQDTKPHQYMLSKAPLSNSTIHDKKEENNFPSFIESALETIHKDIGSNNSNQIKLSERNLEPHENNINSLMHSPSAHDLLDQKEWKEKEGYGEDVVLTANNSKSEDDKDSGDDESSTEDDDNRLSTVRNAIKTDSSNSNILNHESKTLSDENSNKRSSHESTDKIKQLISSNKPWTIPKKSTSPIALQSHDVHSTSPRKRHEKGKRIKNNTTLLKSRQTLVPRKKSNLSKGGSSPKRRKMKNVKVDKRIPNKRKLSKEQGLSQAR